jgi:hypothetical protein
VIANIQQRTEGTFLVFPNSYEFIRNWREILTGKCLLFGFCISQKVMQLVYPFIFAMMGLHPRKSKRQSDEEIPENFLIRFEKKNEASPKRGRLHLHHNFSHNNKRKGYYRSNLRKDARRYVGKEQVHATSECSVHFPFA